ncbi:MAG: tRNA uridine-5-carboxymethylaminomethyl(34) synthesis GTPase MnmE [Pseudomonadota bacterium]
MTQSQDTIFALSTGRGIAAVAVVRVSGPQAFNACRIMAGGELPAPRVATLRCLRDESGRLLDQALVLTFPEPDSFTGENIVEFHVHGGSAVVSGVLEALGNSAGLRPAAAGEFTRRAFLNGKLDLTSVEGLGDLLMAETALQRDQALRQAGGHLRDLYDGWRQRLIELAALITAEIDFVDEEDIPADLPIRIRPLLSELISDMEGHLATSAWGERVRDGVTVVIAGAPNAGKSSLLNALAGRDAAIVSEIAGTTRDMLEVHLDLDGIPAVLVDTAGLRATSDAIEQEGVRRALTRIEDADLVLWLSEGGGEPDFDGGRIPEETILRVATKSDLYERSDLDMRLWIATSAVTGAGLDALVEAVRERLMVARPEGESTVVTRERHRVAVFRAIRALQQAQAGDVVQSPELVADDVMTAVRSMEHLTGRVDVEDLLDVVFASFCIGK